MGINYTTRAPRAIQNEFWQSSTVGLEDETRNKIFLIILISEPEDGED